MSSPGPAATFALTASVLLLGSALPATAGVRLTVGEDGVPVLEGEGVPAPAPGAAERLLRPSPELLRLISSSAHRADLDPRLVQAVIQVESGYDPAAVSVKGAMGLMQVMPETARLLGVEDAFESAQNVAAGSEYLRRMLERFDGDLTLALAAYNAGPDAVIRHGGVPPFTETRDYVRRVLRLYRDDPGLEPRPAEISVGRKTYLVRTADDRILMTTTPPGRR